MRDSDHLSSSDCVLICCGKNDLAVGVLCCAVPVRLRIIIGVIPDPRVGGDNTALDNRIQVDRVVRQHLRHFAEKAFDPLLNLLVARAVFGEFAKVLRTQFHHGAVSCDMVLLLRSIVLCQRGAKLLRVLQQLFAHNVQTIYGKYCKDEQEENIKS